MNNEDNLTPEILISWDFPEFEKYERNRTWYLIASLIFIALLIYAVFTANFLFAVIIIFVSIILYFQEKHEQIIVTFAITPDGLILGEKFYAFKEIKKFYLIYEPPEVKKLYIEFKNFLKPRLGIPLLEQNPVRVREILVNYLDEDLDKEYEPLTDKIGRFFKF